MKPINDFHEDVQTLGGRGDHVDDIGILPLRYEYLGDNAVMVSCWRVTWRDLLRMLFTRKLWLVVMGTSWPPLFIETDKQYTGVDEWDAAKAAESVAADGSFSRSDSPGTSSADTYTPAGPR